MEPYPKKRIVEKAGGTMWMVDPRGRNAEVIVST